MKKLYSWLCRDPKQLYVYVWTHQDECVYVGYGTGLRGVPRPKESANAGRSVALKNWIKKHWNQVVVRTISCSTLEEARNTETSHIQQLTPRFNKSSVHGGCAGMHSEEGKKKIGDAQRGKQLTEEQKKHISSVHRGKTISQAQKDAVSKAHKGIARPDTRQRMLGNKNLLGHKHSEETKLKISESSSGRTLSPLGRQKASERLKVRNARIRAGEIVSHRKGIPLTEEHKRKLSEAAKRRRKTHNALQD